MSKISAEVLPDHCGQPYITLLGRLHQELRPLTYLEIGTNAGQSLAESSCASLAIDPHFVFTSPLPVMGKPLCALYEMTSDDFFRKVDPTVILGAKIDLAFLDGMHRCEFLLRDFYNTEKFCRPNSVIALHDCIPVEYPMAERTPGATATSIHRSGWWTGDVWRVVLALQKFRPDLSVTSLDAPPTGLTLVTNLDPTSKAITENYYKILSWMFSLSLEDYTLRRLHSDINVESTSIVDSEEKLTRLFWL